MREKAHREKAPVEDGGNCGRRNSNSLKSMYFVDITLRLEEAFLY